MTIGSILASLVAAILFMVFGFLVKSRIVPYIRAALNPTLDLSGTWYCSFVTPAGNPHQLVLVVRQRWRFLDGEIAVTKHVAAKGITETKTFSLGGEVRERMVLLTAWNSDTRALGVHTELLEVVGDARIMHGLGLWYSVTNKVIQSNEFEWTRIRSARPRHDE